MPRPGRPPKPTEQKRRTGNPGKRSLPDKATLRPVPPVDADAVELTVEQAMERSVIAGKAWLAESDSVAVALLREALEFYVALRNNPMSKPADVLAALKVVMAAASDCGFTPGERSRLGLAEVTAQSKLEELRARRTKVADQDKAG